MNEPNESTKESPTPGEIDHHTAVRIANNGQGAIVTELLRLSHDLRDAQAHVVRLSARVEETEEVNTDLLAALVACKEYIGVYHNASNPKAPTVQVYETASAAIRKATEKEG